MRGEDLILIVGMGRSGTSALTRVLSLSGCTLPDLVAGAMEINPKGAWEPIEAWKLNGDFMKRYGTGFMDPSMRLQGEITFSEKDKEEYIGKIQMFLGNCPPGKVLVVKNPVITELMEFWLEGARRSGLSVKVVVVIRHPREVLDSITAMLRKTKLTVSIELMSAHWTKMCLLAERRSRGLPRVFVEYCNLLKDWRGEIRRVEKELSIDLKPNEIAIDDFLTADLHRQRHSGSVMERFAYSWMTRVYAILSDAARDEPIDFHALDEIYHAFQANERVFRIAWDEFQDNMARSEEAGEGNNGSVSIWKLGQDFS